MENRIPSVTVDGKTYAPTDEVRAAEVDGLPYKIVRTYTAGVLCWLFGASGVAEVLQAVHLLLALDLFAVVVGVDPRWLLHSLRDQYRSTLAGPAAGEETLREDTERLRHDAPPTHEATRSTATSCRSVRTSTSLAASVRASRAS
jgi:hypothetical protein